MPSTSFGESWARTFVNAVQSLLDILQDPEAEELLESLGVPMSLTGISSETAALSHALSSAQNSNISFDNLEDIANSLTLLKELYLAIEALQVGLISENPSAEEQLSILIGHLFLDNLWYQNPAVVALLALAGAIETRELEGGDTSYLISDHLNLLGPEYLRLRPSGLSRISNGGSGVFELLNTQDVTSYTEAAEAISLAIDAIGSVAQLPFRSLLSREPISITLPSSEIFEVKGRGVVFDTPRGISFDVLPGVVMNGGEPDRFGALVRIGSEGTVQLDDSAHVQVEGKGEVVVSSKEAIAVNMTSPSLKIKVAAKYDFLAEGEPRPLLIGASNGPRFEAEALHLSATFESALGSGEVRVGIQALLPKAKFATDTPSGDRFLSSIIGSSLSNVTSTVGIGFQSGRGIYLVGGDGLQLNAAEHIELGSITICSLSVSTRSGVTEICFDVGFKVGPAKGRIEDLGVSVFGSVGGGSLGVFDLKSFQVKPPSGVALNLESAAVSGGGYLFFDAAAQEYGGAVELSFMSFGLAAVGLITTQMPDGSSGFSMMVIISAEFQGVQLGFGFTLTGVGGLLGINRQADVQALRSNMKNGGLSSIMFPENVVENAQRIVSDVGAAFPVAEGNHVFGPILRIGWGTPTLFELTMGVVLSFPSPFKVVLIGRFQLGMPSLEYDGDVPPPIWVNIDFLGVIDPAAGLLSLDGVLYDSRLAAFSLEGQFAMQQTFGDDPLFLVSIGGFHPNFEPPPQVPDLKRLSLTLGDSDNPRIRTELYTAITSNTAQVGARVDVFAKAAGFKVLGAAGFDALVVFSPFSLDVTFFIRAAVKRSSSTLFSINVNLNLTGPNPWRAKGEASFEVLFLTVKVRFSLTFGSSEAPRLPETDVLEKLKSALAETRNWSVKLPERTREPAVTFRELPAAISESLLHPEASLTVRQQVVPFGLDIERYSGAIPTAEGRRVRRFDIESLSLNGTLYSADQPDQITKEKEKFAPGAYLELSDEEKLSRPSFESFTAGATLAGSQGYAIPDSAKLKTVVTNYEQSVVDTSTGFAFDFQPLDENGNVIPMEDIKASDAVIFSTVADDSGVKSSVYQPKKLAIRVDDPAYTVVSRGDADRMTNIAANTNFYEANKALKDSGQSKQDYHIVLVHEEKAA